MSWRDQRVTFTGKYYAVIDGFDNSDEVGMNAYKTE